MIVCLTRTFYATWLTMIFQCTVMTDYEAHHGEVCETHDDGYVAYIMSDGDCIRLCEE